MELGLEIPKKLILVVFIFSDHLGKINVFLHNGRHKATSHIVGSPFIAFVLHNGINPGFEQASENSQILAAVAYIFDVSAENEIGREPHLLGELTEVVIVDDLSTKTC